MKKSVDPADRRRSKRRPILDTFSLFVVLPKKGAHRLAVHDVSELGLRFDLNLEGEEAAEFPITNGERLELHFYLNQSLFLPLPVQIVRVESGGPVIRAGAEIVDAAAPASQGYQAFLAMLD